MQSQNKVVLLTLPSVANSVLENAGHPFWRTYTFVNIVGCVHTPGKIASSLPQTANQPPFYTWRVHDRYFRLLRPRGLYLVVPAEWCRRGLICTPVRPGRRAGNTKEENKPTLWMWFNSNCRKLASYKRDSCRCVPALTLITGLGVATATNNSLTLKTHLPNGSN